ncbi:adenylosuccinate lyase, partial [bacterium]|nr:adenylosuccinate lyase [bacterium]
MIERYSYKPISSIWSYSGRLKRFVKIEAEAVRYYESTGEVPRGSADKIARAKISKNDVIEREKITKHDIIAFLEALEEASGVSKGLHMGLTSSDILDTATGMQIRDTAKVVRRLIKSIEKILLELIHKWKGVTIMGRTHNVHAEPTTLGLKFLNHLSEFDRCAANLLNALDQGSAGVISGAVGTYAVLSPEMERYVLKNLRLKRIIGTNQVIQRDIHARIA